MIHKFKLNGEDWLARLPEGYQIESTRLAFKGERPFIRAKNPKGQSRMFPGKLVKFMKDKP